MGMRFLNTGLVRGMGFINDLVNATAIALGGNLTITETGTPPAGTYTILSSYASITGTFSEGRLKGTSEIIKE